MQAASAPPRPRTTWARSSVLVGLALLVILAIALILVNLTVKRTGGTSVAAPAMDVSTVDADSPSRAPPAAAPVAAPVETPRAAPAPGPGRRAHP